MVVNGNFKTDIAMTYKGIDLTKNKEMFNYISTYHILDREKYLKYLDANR